MLRGLCEGGSRHVRLTSAPVRLSDHRGAQKGEISCNVRRPLHLHFHLILTAGRATRPAGRGLPDRATYVFSTPTDGRTNHLPACLPACLPDLVAGVRCPGDAPLMPSNRCFGRPEPPTRLPPSTNREGEKKEGEKELVDQPGDDGGGARSHSLTYRSRRAAWPAPLARSPAQVMSTYLPKQFVNRKERKKKATAAAVSGYLPQ